MQVSHTSQIWTRYINKHLWFILDLGRILPTQMILLLLAATCDKRSHSSGCYHFILKVIADLQIVLCGPHALKHERRAEMMMAHLQYKNHQRKSPQGKNTLRHLLLLQMKGQCLLFLLRWHYSHDVFSGERSSETHVQRKAAFLGNVMTFLLRGLKDVAWGRDLIVMLSRDPKKTDILTAINYFIRGLNEILLY